jgi:hypothetical protein
MLCINLLLILLCVSRDLSAIGCFFESFEKEPEDFAFIIRESSETGAIVISSCCLAFWQILEALADPKDCFVVAWDACNSSVRNWG